MNDKPRLINWVDLDALPKNYRYTYEKTLTQVVEPDVLFAAIKDYMHANTSYNIFGLANHLGMTKYRFISNYLKSDDVVIRDIAQYAVDSMTNHAMCNPEQYSKTLRYIMAQAETGKAFIELDEQVQQTKATVLVLPPLDNVNNDEDVDDDEDVDNS